MEPEDKNKKLLLELKALIINFAGLFGFEKFSGYFINYLKGISVPTRQVCAKEMKNVGLWYCKECAKHSNSIICEECYENGKDKHKGHTLQYRTTIDGCCDCGNPDYWDPKGFCSTHKGLFSNDEEIENYLNKCFNRKKLIQIRSIIREICEKVGQYLISYPIQQKAHPSGQFSHILSIFFHFLLSLSEQNDALLQIIAQILSESNSFTTNNPCVLYNDELITLTHLDHSEHQCKCPLITLIFCAWDDKLSYEKLLFFFLKNFKLRYVMGISYFSFYNIIVNNHAKDLLTFYIQLTSKQLMKTVAKSKDVLQSILNNFYTKANESILIKEYSDFKELVISTHSYFHNLLTYPVKNYVNKCFFIYQKIINVLELFENINFHIFQKININNIIQQGPIEELIDIEFNLINFTSNMLQILDFQDIPFAANILLYFDSKIKKNKNKLADDSYSFHIPLLRGFSLFIIHFGIALSIGKKTDFYTSIKNIFSMIPDWKELCEIIAKDVIKVMGFSLSTNCNYWLYYQDMIYYHGVYFCNAFAYCDFVLAKIVFTLCPNLFTIKNIIEWSSVNDSHKIITDNFIDNSEYSIESFEETNPKSFSLIRDVLYLLIRILRNNTFFILSYFLNFRSEKEDKILYSKELLEVLQTERENLKEILKLVLIHIIFELGDSTSTKNIYKYLFKCFQNLFSKEEIDNVIIEISTQVQNKNEGVRISLKQEYLNKYDFSVYSNPYFCSSSQRYILEFKKNEISLLNTINLPCLNLLKILYNTCYKAFFENEDNMKLLIKLVKAFILDKKILKYTSEFLYPILKLISIFIIICKDENEFEHLKNKYNEDLIDLTKVINDNFPNDENNKLLFLYIQKNISELYSVNTNINKPSKSIIENKNKNKKSKNNLLKKFKNKFQNKNNQILKQFGEEFIIEQKFNSNTTQEITINNDYCIICRGELSPQNYFNEPYGKLCLCVNDNLIYLGALKSIREEFNKFYPEKKKGIFNHYISSFKTINNQEVLHLRFSSCSHKIHFNCFKKYTTIEDIFHCPLCRNCYNIYIPDFPKEFKESLYPKISFMDILYKELQEDSNVKENVAITIKAMINQLKKKKNISEDEEDFDFLFSVFAKDFNWWLIFFENNPINIHSFELIQDFLMTLRASHIWTKKFLKNYLNLLILKIVKIKNDIIKIISDGDLHYIFSKILFILLLLLPSEELKNNRDEIMKLFLPLITFSAFIKHLYTVNNLTYDRNIFMKGMILENIKDSYNYSINDITKTQSKFFLSFFRQYTLAEAIADFSNVKWHNINIHQISLKEYFSLFGLNKDNMDTMQDILFNNSNTTSFSLNSFTDYIKIMISFYENTNSFIHPFLLNIGTETPLKFIDLPENMLELLSKYHNIPCFNCSNKPTTFVLCLICGKKICFGERSCFKDFNSSKVRYSIFHSIHCGGLCPFLNSGNGKLSFYFYESESVKEFSIYVDKFGESPIGKEISGEFKFNKEAYQHALKCFIDLSFLPYNENISELPMSEDVHRELADEI